MKNKLPKPVKVILIYVIGVLLCFVLYYFIDEILNGSFVDWFEENYMITDIDNTTSIFPKEYAEISTQMVEIKATMQRHEQIKLNNSTFWTQSMFIAKLGN